MQNTQEKLGNSLLKNLIGLRESKGEIRIEDLGAILQGMASSMQSATNADRFIKSEIERMAEFIVHAKGEIQAMIPEEGESKNINTATLELNEVVKATENATNTIMDAADTIQEVAGSLADADASSKIMDETMKLYDACSFQDITGQRINKVLRTLEEVEHRVMNLMQLFGSALPEGYVPPAGIERAYRADEALMNGPQLSKDLPSQDDIDQLFAAIKN